LDIKDYTWYWVEGFEHSRQEESYRDIFVTKALSMMEATKLALEHWNTDPDHTQRTEALKEIDQLLIRRLSPKEGETPEEFDAKMQELSSWN